MSDDAKADLIYAILAMDAYNRGYGSGITSLLEAGRIGDFTIGEIVNRSGWFDAGFYAIAYKKGDDVVISYRGTDFNTDLFTDPISNPVTSPVFGGSA